MHAARSDVSRIRRNEGVSAAAFSFLDGAPWIGLGTLAACAVLFSLVSPVPFPRSIAAREAQARSAADSRPIVYWRPGCPYCLRLRLRLGREAHRTYWVNIRKDPAGAVAVRAITGADETVPTVVAGADSFVNPDPRQLLRRLRP